MQETLTLADELQIVKEHMAELARAAPKAERYYSPLSPSFRYQLLTVLGRCPIDSAIRAMLPSN